MTCIAALPGHMMSDSRETGAIKRSCIKFFRKHGYLIGGAGSSAPLAMLEHVVAWPKRPTVAGLTKWIYQHHSVEALNFEEIELLIVTPKHVIEVEGRVVHPPALSGAVGSGAAWAQGYLLGKPGDLKGAVEAACRFDPYCAGPVREAKL
jgi:hypothetical protein